MSALNKFRSIFFLLASIAASLDAFAQQKDPKKDPQKDPDSISIRNAFSPEKTAEKIASDNGLQIQGQNDEKDASSDKKPVDNSVKNLGKIIALDKNSDISLSILQSRTSSMMYDEKELKNIDRAITALKNQESFSPDQDENTPIINKEEVQKKVIEEISPEQSYVYLASILYISPNSWVIWLGDNKITTENNSRKNEFYVTKIDRDKVKIMWKLGITKWNILTGNQADSAPPKTNQNNEVETLFTLHPNQTFILKSKKVVEGNSVIETAKAKQQISEADDSKDNTTAKKGSSGN